MREILKAACASRVTALFEDDAQSFMLPAGATFEDLASQFEHVAARSSGKPVAITVKLAAAMQR